MSRLNLEQSRHGATVSPRKTKNPSHGVVFLGHAGNGVDGVKNHHLCGGLFGEKRVMGQEVCFSGGQHRRKS